VVDIRSFTFELSNQQTFLHPLAIASPVFFLIKCLRKKEKGKAKRKGREWPNFSFNLTSFENDDAAFCSFVTRVLHKKHHQYR
jgi:hypothetical protein